MLSRDEDILKAAEDWRKAGRGVALATVVETWGSAPRPVGSNLVIDNEGNFLGSVSGGCVEGAVVTEAIDVIDSGKPKMLEFGVADESRLERRPVLRRHHPRLCREGELSETRHPARAQCRTRRAARGRRRHRCRERRAAAGQGRRRGARIRCGKCIEKHLRMAKSGMEETAQGRVFLTVHVPSPQLVITGAVHISQTLAPIGQLLGYDVTIVDPRTAFASIERFPDVKVIAEWPDVALPPLNVDHYTAFVALTHDPKIDDPALKHALARDCFYIGALGSQEDPCQARAAAEGGGAQRRRYRAHPCADRARHRRGVAGRDRRFHHGRDHRAAAA